MLRFAITALGPFCMHALHAHTQNEKICNMHFNKLSQKLNGIFSFGIKGEENY